MTTKHLESFRSFNRFYTDILGLLNKFILQSNYSLPEVRVMYEIYHQPGCTAKKIMESFTIDKGYLSRILLNFQKTRIITSRPSAEDGRLMLLELTGKGKQEFEKLNVAADSEIMAILEHKSNTVCDELIQHMNEIKKILSQ